MSYDFLPAVREGVSLIVSIAGASGSGKTRSALRLARGIVGGDMSKVFVIDTEARRALHHADVFIPRFRHLDLQPPFRPERFQEAIQAAIEAGAGAVVTDSFSDEYEGEGGIVEWAETSETPGAAAWKEPKRAHKHFLNYVRQVRVPLIFCLRAEERVRIEPDPDKPRKTRVVPLGWMPVCEKRWMYDMTLSLTLAPDTKGCPRSDLPHKLPDFATAWFRDGQMIDEAAGAALADWARGEDPEAATRAARVFTVMGLNRKTSEFATIERWAKWWDGPIQDAPPDKLKSLQEVNSALLTEYAADYPDVVSGIRERIKARLERAKPTPGGAKAKAPLLAMAGGS